MYNHRLRIAGLKDDIESILKAQGISPSDYNKRAELEAIYPSPKFLRLAIYFDIRNIPFDRYYGIITKGINDKKIDPDIQTVSNFVKLNGKKYTDILEFTEYLDGPDFMTISYEKSGNKSDTEYRPVISNESYRAENNSDHKIEIYEINDANDGRNLVGSDTSWCIGYKGSNNMWQSYRTRMESTFFVVFDSNPPSDLLRKVAIDFTKDGVLLTDIKNRTGKNLTNDSNWGWNEYSRYLADHGIDLNSTRANRSTGEEEQILKNKPLLFEEKLANHAISRKIDLETVMGWQKGISKIEKFSSEGSALINDLPSSMEQVGESRSFIQVKDPEAPYYLSKYIGNGAILDDAVFDLLIKSKNEDLLNKYVNTGVLLPPQQIDHIREFKTPIFRSYIVSQLKVVEMNQAPLDSVLRLVDPDKDEWAKTKIIETAKGLDENKHGLMYSIEKWVKFPEIFEHYGPEMLSHHANDFDELQIKLAIACGVLSIYKDHVDLENSKLLFSDSFAIDNLLEIALRSGYTNKMKYFISSAPYNANFKGKIPLGQVMPRDIQQKLGVDKIYDGINYSDKLPEEIKSDIDVASYAVFMHRKLYLQQNDHPYIAKKEFWLNLINNFDNYYHKLGKYRRYFTDLELSPSGKNLLFKIPQLILMDEEILSTARKISKLSEIIEVIDSYKYNQNIYLNKNIQQFFISLVNESAYNVGVLLTSPAVLTRPVVTIIIEKYPEFMKQLVISRLVDESLFKYFVEIHPELHENFDPYLIPGVDRSIFDEKFFNWLKDNYPVVFNSVTNVGWVKEFLTKFKLFGFGEVTADCKKFIKIANILDKKSEFKLSDFIMCFVEKKNV